MTTRMTRAERLQLDEKLLQQHFGPSWHLQGTRGPSHGVIGKLKTNEGNEYVVFVPVSGYPDGPPRAFIVSPELRGRGGRQLPELSHDFHTRERDEHGHVQVCHYADSVWTPAVTLYRVVLKVRIWLEAYERYLATGKSPGHFLVTLDP